MNYQRECTKHMDLLPGFGRGGCAELDWPLPCGTVALDGVISRGDTERSYLTLGGMSSML